MTTIANDSQVADKHLYGEIAILSDGSGSKDDTRAYRVKLLRVCQIAIAILCLKVLFSLLWEYRNYFPANFESAFLSGRRYSFLGWYRVGFYVHIVTGPIAILLAAFLMVSSGAHRFRRAHRIAGRTLGVVVLILLPSSLMMASQAYAGPIAGGGFAVLAVMTAITCVMAGRQARAKRFVSHQRWAWRCFLLLCSPLVLRVMSGVAIVTGCESDLTYRLNAWLSWLVPLLAYEGWLSIKAVFPFALPHETAK